MSREPATVVFLGAGASREFGYPVTGQILPRVVSTWSERGSLFKDMFAAKRAAGDRRELRQFVEHLLPGISDVSDESLPLITELFSLVDYCVLQGSAIIPGLSNDEMRRYRDLLKQAIYYVLVENWEQRWTEEELALGKQLADWLNGLPNVAVISTNYDTVVEDVLFEHSYDREDSIENLFDFGFDWRDTGANKIHQRPSNPQVRLYKLHGSLNRLRCGLCEYVYVNTYGPIGIHAFRPDVDDNNTCYCGHARLEMQIVAPSLVRDIRDPTLLQTWKLSQEALRRASCWYIIGYSLPPEDLAIRDLILRAYHARQNLPDVTVVQLENDALDRYRLLFPQCSYKTGGLAAFLNGGAQQPVGSR